ncbi:MAG TPA: hypothetical protein VF104_11595 [Burkholderiales bacterium]
MAGSERLICPSSELAEPGAGVRFTLAMAGTERRAFAVRFRGRVYAFLNQCAHTGL